MRITYQPNHFKCNVCEARCPFDKKLVNKMPGTDRCKSFVAPDTFRVPILLRQLTKNATVVHQLLGAAGLRFREIEHYPFFRLEVK